MTDEILNKLIELIKAIADQRILERDGNIDNWERVKVESIRKEILEML